MRSRSRLSTKFFSLGLGLLVLALVSIGLTMWVTRQLDGGAAAVNEAGRLRMQAWRLVSAKATDRPQVDTQKMVAEFDATVDAAGLRALIAACGANGPFELFCAPPSTEAGRSAMTLFRRSVTWLRAQ